jgi:methionyl aminopeptidase
VEFFDKMNVEIKTDKEIEKMRIAGRVTAEVLDKLPQIIKPGITTKDIDVWVEKYIRSLNMIPAFLGIEGKQFPFPASACISVNDEVVHGIPDKSRRLQEGDIVSVDVGVLYDGYYGDAARTYSVGIISLEAARLLDITKESLENGIKQAIAGKRLGDVSYAVQKTVEDAGFSVVRDFVGHGIGRHLHEDPPIANFGRADTGIKLTAGMALAIEPMVNIGKYEVETLDNDWTVITKDRSLSAHFENTIIITKDGNEILTRI